MTEIAIFAVSSAGVTIVVAVSMFLLGRRAADAERRVGDQGIARSVAEGKLLAATQACDNWKARANEEAERNAALSDLLAEAATHLDPAGARARLHAAWFRLHHPGSVPAADRPAVPVPGEPAAAGPDDSDLERP